MDPIFDGNDPLSFLGESNIPEPEEVAPQPLTPSDEELSEEEAADQPKTHRDLQRGALQELVDLVSECATLEGQIETELQSTLSEAQGTGQRQLSDSERKYKTLQDQITSKVGDRKGQIDARYEQAIASLKVNEQNIRNRVRMDFDLAQQQIKKD